MKYGRQISSGGVLYRSAADVYEVALIKPRGGRVYALPKGLIDAGEDPEETALREVREETGMDGEIISPLGYIRYYYYSREEDTRYFKLVHFFLLRYLGGSEKDHDREVEEVVWVPAQEALGLLAYKGEKEVLARALDILNEREDEGGDGREG
ncbi:MAG: NUDIX hydrolase [Actinobacteria bacterium]|nr:NUDIX hydrolase [Actinomycetota bacterium]